MQPDLQDTYVEETAMMEEPASDNILGDINNEVNNDFNDGVNDLTEIDNNVQNDFSTNAVQEDNTVQINEAAVEDIPDDF